MPSSTFDFAPVLRRSDTLAQVEKTANACRGCISDQAYDELFWLRNNIANAAPEPYSNLVDRLKANMVRQVEPQPVSSIIENSGPVTVSTARTALMDVANRSNSQVSNAASVISFSNFLT